MIEYEILDMEFAGDQVKAEFKFYRQKELLFQLTLKTEDSVSIVALKKAAIDLFKEEFGIYADLGANQFTFLPNGLK